jgi:hypothetical protein
MTMPGGSSKCAMEGEDDDAEMLQNRVDKWCEGEDDVYDRWQETIEKIESPVNPVKDPLKRIPVPKPVI